MKAFAIAAQAAAECEAGAAIPPMVELAVQALLMGEAR